MPRGRPKKVKKISFSETPPDVKKVDQHPHLDVAGKGKFEVGDVAYYTEGPTAYQFRVMQRVVYPNSSDDDAWIWGTQSASDTSPSIVVREKECRRPRKAARD